MLNGSFKLLSNCSILILNTCIDTSSIVNNWYKYYIINFHIEYGLIKVKTLNIYVVFNRKIVQEYV